jgi:hypothetical protein
MVIGAVMQRKTFSGAGRKPRQGVQRYANRHIVRRDQGEVEADVLRTAVSARVRIFGVAREDARDSRLGSSIGRLRASAHISAIQHTTALRFARIVSLQNLLDDVRPGYGIPAAARLAATFGRDPYDNLNPDNGWDATDSQRRLDTIAKIRRDNGDLTQALIAMEASETTRGAASLLNAVIMWDRDIPAADGASLGVLRCALNVLARMWGIADET